MAVAISGFRGRVVVAGVPLLATKWNVTYKTELQDASSFEETTGGLLGANTPISRYVQSMSDLEFSVDAYYDAIDGIIPAMKPGASVVLELFTNKGLASGINYAGDGATKKFMFTGIIDQLTVDTEVRGVIKYTLGGKVSGGTGIMMA